MTGEDHPKLVLGEQIQAALQSPEVAQQLEDAALTRWLLVAEVALPDGAMGLAIVTSNAVGDDLTTWDKLGLLNMALLRVKRGAT